MSKYMTISAQAVTLVVGAILAGNLAHAGPALEIPYAAQEVASVDYGPATQWTDDEGVWHVRGAIFTVQTTGSAGGLPISAVGVGDLDLNINTQTGYGDVHITSTYEMTWGDWFGTMHGHSHSTYTAFQWESEWGFPRCTGDLAGMKLRGTSWGTLGVPNYESEGVILLPHGMPGGSPVNDGEATSWGAIKASFK